MTGPGIVSCSSMKLTPSHCVVPAQDWDNNVNSYRLIVQLGCPCLAVHSKYSDMRSPPVNFPHSKRLYVGIIPPHHFPSPGRISLTSHTSLHFQAPVQLPVVLGVHEGKSDEGRQVPVWLLQAPRWPGAGQCPAARPGQARQEGREGGGGLSHQTRPGGGGHLPAQGETHHPHTQPGASGGRYRHLHDASSLHFSWYFCQW